MTASISCLFNKTKVWFYDNHIHSRHVGRQIFSCDNWIAFSFTITATNGNNRSSNLIFIVFNVDDGTIYILYEGFCSTLHEGLATFNWLFENMDSYNAFQHEKTYREIRKKWPNNQTQHRVTNRHIILTIRLRCSRLNLYYIFYVWYTWACLCTVAVYPWLDTTLVLLNHCNHTSL